jgi:hypothetical protein
MKIFMLVSALFLLNGCAVKNVKSWEKGTLAKETMLDGGGNVLFKKFTSHIYFSKEASKGGGGVAGGGCGCN